MKMDEKPHSTLTMGEDISSIRQLHARYLAAAKEAAILERSGWYKEAAAQWELAALLAQSSVEREWSEVRHRLCKRVHARSNVL